MEDEGSAISQLGNLALGNLLTDLGVSSNANNVSTFVGGSKNGPKSEQMLEQDQIYNDRYEDDDFDMGELPMEGRENGAQDEVEEAQRHANQDRYYRMGMEELNKSSMGTVRGEVDDFDEDYDDADKEADSSMIHIKEEAITEATQSSPLLPTPSPPPLEVDVTKYWPGFERGKILNFTEIFTHPPQKRRRLVDRGARHHFVAEEDLPVPRSSREGLSQPAWIDTSKATNSGLVKELAKGLNGKIDSDEELRVRIVNGKDGLNNLALDDWEKKILWDEAAEVPHLPVNVSRPFNRELESGEWLKGIIWDEGCKHKDFTSLILDLNDPEMMLETQGDEQEKSSSLVRIDAPAVSQKAARAAAGLDPFNLSNDRFYEISKEHRMRSIRQTLGQLELQHSRPAVRLQLPFYKTRLTKAEARDFHRPGIQFPSNIPLRFSKVRKEKRSKDESGGRSRSKKDVSQVLKTTRDLTLKDTSSFVLYEYSEEYPPVLSNLGMGSLLVNYYRKKDARDEHIPKLDLGEAVVLDVSDESPFMKFGSVEPGRVQPTLYNRMIRAPLFRHKAATTDFLLVRSTTKNEVRYYLRDIKNLFVVGQTYPLVQVPGPHARLVTNALKHRMQLITYKLLQKSVGERIKIHRIMKYFPDQNELQMRQRMKEFMEYHRRDKDQGFWKLKVNHVPPTEADLHEKLPPEHLCLCEAMQAGQRHLLDAGYTKTAEGYDDDMQDESKMDIEQLLAPWITTKNFLNATQGKAMLKLYGNGDPTGRGEAFSFLRVSMKDIFIRAGETDKERMAIQQLEEEKSGHKYNVARQQAVYRSEVQRIWDTQRKALENPRPAQLTTEDMMNHEAATNASTNQNHIRSQSIHRAQSIRRDASSPGGESSRMGTPDDNESQMGLDSNKVLRIRRFYGGKWHTEIVREHSVIHAYIRQRQRLQDERTATEALLPTGDATLDAARKRRLEEELRASLKNRDRRLQRKNAKAMAEGIQIEGGARMLLNKTETKRRCGRCGEVGHMSTNTSCPKYEVTTNPTSTMQMQGIPSTSSGANNVFGMAGNNGSSNGGNIGGGSTSTAGNTPMGSRRPSMMSMASGTGVFGMNNMIPQSPITPTTPGPGSSTFGDAGSPPARNSGGIPKLKIKLKR
ncbi:hypothetical protein CBS101457_002658 [Exobasidium rhododendri]|nr:hypothetical protein CBS101457_002658 [Exobasidium rhododendri]